ncbi:unnamed protein product [Phytophthora lilii]|uniref:Unnamed protein product n=1 Tax=Phytophthora lilii TaxID=2077276 RepID=A0A9W6TJI5_9STRA|nr:unnamed protein product [Phytophthora lilii]
MGRLPSHWLFPMGAHLSAERPSPMPSPKEMQAADASSAAPTESPAPSAAVEDAPVAPTADAASRSAAEAAEPELAARDEDAAVGAQDAEETDAAKAPAASQMEEKESAEQTPRCSECNLVESATRGDVLRVCAGCKFAVHDRCYADALPAPEEPEEGEKAAEAEREDETMDGSYWKCDCCRRGVERRTARCVYCCQVGEGALKAVDTSKDAGFWSRYGEFGEEREGAVQFGHVLCVNWDPRRLAAHTVKESKIKRVEKVSKKEAAKEAAKEGATDESKKGAEKVDKPAVEEVEEVVPDVNELMMRDPLTPSECCFCDSTAGVRIQCRRVNCAQFFHVLCAHKGNGHVELRTDHIPQFHAYCDRHRECTEDIGDLLAKLVTRPIRLLVGRDDMRRFGTVAKHLPDYTSAAAVMHDLAALMVGYCHKGLRTSKSEPPDYNVKHLQVLQFFLSHVPQLEKVYGLPPTPAQDFVNDKKLFRRLERTFNPPRYLAKYPGPFSQQYTCDVCLDPFHERQHLFYCAGGDESAVPHVQHWRCTKRRSSARERERYLPLAGNTGTKKKRKALSIVLDGVRKDITLPKGLPGLTDDIICGVCRAPVDARGLIASRKEAKRLDFEKKESKFVQNGCYINPPSTKGYNGYSYGTSTNAASRKHSKTTDGKPNGSLPGQLAVAQQALGPPKMDRINVQRTTRWLDCVAQIIRLAGAPASKASESSTPARPTAATTTPSTASQPATATSASTTRATASESGTTAPPVNNGAAATAAPTPAVNGTNGVKEGVADKVSGAPPPVSTEPRPATNGTSKLEPERENSPTSGNPSTRSTAAKTVSLVTPAMKAHFDEAMRLVRPYDSYALSKLETAHDMLLHRSGPGVAVLRMLTHEYTRFMYIKHTRAVEKARNEKRKREEHEAQEHREKERKRMNLEAERALKKQMLAMRNKQRQHLKATSSK